MSLINPPLLREHENMTTEQCSSQFLLPAFTTCCSIFLCAKRIDDNKYRRLEYQRAKKDRQIDFFRVWRIKGSDLFGYKPPHKPDILFGSRHRLRCSSSGDIFLKKICFKKTDSKNNGCNLSEVLRSGLCVCD